MSDQEKVDAFSFEGGIEEKEEEINPETENNTDVPLENTAQDIPENQERSQEEQSGEDYSEFQVQAIVGAIPLDPCVVFATIAHPDRPAAYKTISIPGLYDPKHKSFTLFNGKKVKLANFDSRFQEYVESKLQEQARPASV